MSCKGLHCNGCSGGGGKVAAIVVLVLVIAAIGRAVGRAAAEAAHVLAVVLEVAIIAVSSLVAVAVLAGIGWAGVKVRRHTARAAAAGSRPVFQAVPVAPDPLEIEPPRLRPDQHLTTGIREEVTHR